MASTTCCFGLFSRPNGRRSRPTGGADVVVKIGGSACTMKAQFETLNKEALDAAAGQLGALRREGVQMAIIHGAGSFGHQQAKQYGVSKGVSGDPCRLPPSLMEGAAKTRLSVTTLNKHVVTALVKEGVPAMTISPCPFIATESKKLVGGRLPACAADGAVGLLRRGLVPVVHGDVVLDEAQGVAILSGDVWMVELCRELVARSAVFVTDVDGVFTAPPSQPGSELIQEILVDPATGELELTGVSMSTASHDVTGGLRAKLESAAEVLLKAPSVEAVYIVRAGSAAAQEAMRGRDPKKGTTLRRKVCN
jgi:isopentenyl phosphate kinase